MSASRIVLPIIVGALLLGTIVWGTAQPYAVQLPTPVLFGGPSEERDSIVAFEARQAGMDPALAIAISHVENWSGDSAAVHPRSGAIGLMQIMPFWADSFQVECYGPSALTNRRRNACIGSRIAMRYFRECGNWNCALVWYVGARCTRRDTALRCSQKREAGTAYVLLVVTRFGRTDLSPARDAMAYGLWRATRVSSDSGSSRPARFLSLDSNSFGNDTAWRRARDPRAPLFVAVQ